MAEENVILKAEKGPNKRNIGRKKKKPETRAREYNSDKEEDESGPENGTEQDKEELRGGYSSEEAERNQKGQDDENFDDGFSGDEDEGDSEIQPGITKFTEGCRAFRMAFKSIIKKSVQDDGLGPVLSAHKKLVAKKLAEEEGERKIKGEAKKEKHLVGEKGHVKPVTYLDIHEKFLIDVASKGVVKLFNAVNKAQGAQKGLDPSRSKDAKVLRKRQKEALFSELGKTPASTVNTPAMVRASNGQVDVEAPAWAPLRDNYMLKNSKLKDWDKMPDTGVTDDVRRISEDSSSDDDD
ncbi:Rrp15p protein [Parasponia andersonii]|uniref:Rrp15p protein n=1 Tax=Parasponia andersonii TaxID=3476 RepID=A0A2P5AB51_PARAD|nr:Rrp15p protein [Parasponia andersonii]